MLVDKETSERECIKIGIAKGKSWKDVVKRSNAFKFYDIRILKTVTGNLEDIYYLEQYLHEKWSEFNWTPRHKFAGHTECFQYYPEIIKSIPNRV